MKKPILSELFKSTESYPPELNKYISPENIFQVVALNDDFVIIYDSDLKHSHVIMNNEGQTYLFMNMVIGMSVNGEVPFNFQNTGNNVATLFKWSD